MTPTPPQPSDASADRDSGRPTVESLTDDVLRSYDAADRTTHTDAGALPSRARGIELLELLRDLIFPGYYSEDRLTCQNIRAHAERRVADIRELMQTEVAEALAYQQNVGVGIGAQPGDASARAQHVTDEFLRRIPKLRELLVFGTYNPASIYSLPPWIGTAIAVDKNSTYAKRAA